ncbi:MAG: aromatic acid decarboxylase [Gammaproteobacteria bacterium CG22_combo_CG10-13_8_21_14_all_40_8]|nr:MAG: aromatic acid decarboxylase [Gammaproteobacteria bacterium CG22_combo_CG10-13_8_21_14_all_40_8]
MKSMAISLAVTGASGAPYALSLLRQLLLANCTVHFMISDAAKVVFATESQIKLPKNNDAIADYLRQAVGVEKLGELNVYSKNDWMSPVASGSACPKTLVVCPCSTGALSAIACGASDNLIERAADVILKEQGKLILVTREMPLSAIHLENMLKLSRLGVTIMPASPGFYHQPQSLDDLINFVVARILEHIGIEQTLVSKWGYDQPNLPTL